MKRSRRKADSIRRAASKWKLQLKQTIRLLQSAKKSICGLRNIVAIESGGITICANTPYELSRYAEAIDEQQLCYSIESTIEELKEANRFAHAFPVCEVQNGKS
jgi:hypothetical protein